jgi:hypothetical protein
MFMKYLTNLTLNSTDQWTMLACARQKKIPTFNRFHPRQILDVFPSKQNDKNRYNSLALWVEETYRRIINGKMEE